MCVYFLFERGREGLTVITLQFHVYILSIKLSKYFKPGIFNTYKPLHEQTNDVSDDETSSFLLMDGDMRIRQNSELGVRMAKDWKLKSLKLKAREKRKIKKKFYDSGYSSRWPLKTVPYEFDYKISK